MKKFLFVAFALILLMSHTTEADDGWLINSFVSYITIGMDGKVSVEETIELDFNGSGKGLIQREIPYVYRYSGKTIYTKLEVVGVTDGDTRIPYDVSRDKANWKIRIGNPGETIPGTHRYKVNYSVSGVLIASKSYDELYWTVSGTNWPVPIKTSSAIVLLPLEAKPQDGIVQSSCYTGAPGVAKTCNQKRMVTNKLIWFRSSLLNPGEGLTISVAYTKGMVPIPKVSPLKIFLVKFSSSDIGRLKEMPGLGAGLTVLFVVAAAILVLLSIRIIGATEIGLVTKRFSIKELSEDNPVAFEGEAGYQADLLMPGWRFKFWIVYAVKKLPWVQIPAGEIGVVVAQVGRPLPIGAKSARYRPEFGNFTDLKAFMQGGGEKGVQRPVLPPGTLVPIHPVGFLVITTRRVHGVPVEPGLASMAQQKGGLAPETFGLSLNQLYLVRISPQAVGKDGQMVDTVGIITTFEGDPLPPGDIANRLGGFSDVEKMEADGRPDTELVETLLGSKNALHNNYQDFQVFLDNGGRIGLQHDPLLYGAYALNPFLVSVEIVPMLVVEQGEVATIKAYVGLAAQDTSGTDFKFGTLVRPGHRGIWHEPLRTGKYAINPHCYEAVIVPTAILTLNWAAATSQAHQLDAELKPIDAKSREGFVFHIDLQVQIHVADTKAPRVISIVGTMRNLVNEVLQAAVGNHFRDKLQSMPAVHFIETRQRVQEEAFAHIRQQLEQYQVETKGVYIQDVILPEAMVTVLTQREIANQEIETFKKQKEAQDERISMEQAKGTADMQAELSKSQVNVQIQTNNASARKVEAEGEATYIRETGAAKGAEVEAIGLARARGYQAQVEALGQLPTAMVNVIGSLSEKSLKFVPDILVTGGNGPSAVEGLAATLMRVFAPGKSRAEAPATGTTVTESEK